MSTFNLTYPKPGSYKILVIWLALIHICDK